MTKHLEEVSIPWHPGFCSAAEIELISNKEQLEFQREYNLSKEPLRVDLLVIKKLEDIPIENEIGRIFKTYNVIEYKSPEDGLTIDDYYKTVGYACLYKGLGEKVNQIPAEELTVSLFRASYPRELFKSLKEAGLEIEEHFSGIYYIKGNVLFDTQVVVTSRLDKQMHQSLRILSKNVKEEDVRAFIEVAVKLTAPGDKNNIDAILQVSVSANQEIYKKVRRDSVMCEALRQLMKDEIDKEVEERVNKEVQERVNKEVQKAQKKFDKNMLESINNLMKNMKLTAEQAMEALSVPIEERSKYISQL